MARAAYNETITSIAADGTMKAIGNVQVTVRLVGESDPADIWNARAGTGGGVAVSNPMVTGPSGRVSFYADPGEYTISVHDLNAPARIADETYGWDAVSGSQNPEEFGFAMGDLKISAQDVDHGRWLRCDGRELTQAEVEGALNLDAGEALEFANFLGAGAGSLYGAASGSKIKIPDARRRTLLGSGRSADTTPAPAANTTAKNPGAGGGAETITLTAAQSGLPGHGHSFTDPGHNHNASQPAHAHTVNDPGHDHDVDMTSAGGHTSKFSVRTATNFEAGGSKIGVSSIVDYGTPLEAGQSGMTADIQTQNNHSHPLTLDPNDTGITLQNSTPAITVVSNTTGGSVVAHAGAAASASHDNMPPYISIGWVFIRV